MHRRPHVRHVFRAGSGLVCLKRGVHHTNSRVGLHSQHAWTNRWQLCRLDLLEASLDNHLETQLGTFWSRALNRDLIDDHPSWQLGNGFVVQSLIALGQRLEIEH